ncbi:MAG: GTP cyclohydrolase II [Rhodospirillales bacterium]|nr:GTP cyclohydrolase II [Rhodospirillales bacterium]MDH3911999.1 GTP cyclohydrolase II [Rhodospirillales bacterium]MDH3917023.1 GTP cyclohydrolase II [Rhodospirillales bacterium]MDH3966626.1 GTP cyclohydrolase II [Rhodospirillales bacterium]
MSGSLANQTNVDASVLQAVDRATAELRRGGIVLVRGSGRSAALVQAAEGATAANLSAIRDLSRGVPLLLLTVQRAAVLGLVKAAPSAGGVIALDLTGVRAEAVAELADPTCRRSASLAAGSRLTDAPAGLDTAAVDLAKLARLLPAALFVPMPDLADPEGWAAEQDLLSVSASEIAEYRFSAARSLQPVAEAMVPLAGAEATRIVAFRPIDGGFEHLAVIIGIPAPDQAVLTRVHSECFTGDLLGSLRCDCGEQLRGAISSIAESGAGVLLYLAQEGRGIGLVNKLRAYRLQDQGADTLEANQQLGFDADERIYLPAAEILRQLGFRRVRLMTNNPEKVAALTRCGIAVEERVPLSFPSNGHNEFYLATKVRRFGHFT